MKERTELCQDLVEAPEGADLVVDRVEADLAVEAASAADTEVDSADIIITDIGDLADRISEVGIAVHTTAEAVALAVCLGF